MISERAILQERVVSNWIIKSTFIWYLMHEDALGLKNFYIHSWLTIAYEDVGLASLVSLDTKFHKIDAKI